MKMQIKNWIYQIYLPSFKDSNSDGIGDFNGIKEKLPYIKSLGVDYIWIGPFFESPMKDNGYDISDYYKINKIYGNDDDFDDLIKEAKKLNLKIIIDLAFNHTSNEHQWFLKAIKFKGQLSNGQFVDYSQIDDSVVEHYQNYYLFFKDKLFDLNGKMGESTWEYVKNIEMYYFHIFSKYHPDLNWNNQIVRDNIFNIIDFWIKRKVDGIRLDVINLISKNDFFNYWNKSNSLDNKKYLFYTDGPFLLKYLKEISKKIIKKWGNDFYLLGELSSSNPKKASLYSNKKEGFLASSMMFNHLKCNDLISKLKIFNLKKGKEGLKLEKDQKHLLKVFKTLNGYQEAIKNCDSNISLIWNNHDNQRFISQLNWNQKQIKYCATALATFLYLMRGDCVIYQGEEIGMTNAEFKSINDFRDIETKNFYQLLSNQGWNQEEILKILNLKTRDNSRTPMQWKNEKYAGFSDYEPWIKINQNYQEINVENENENKDSILNFYRNLIKITKEESIFINGEVEFDFDQKKTDKNLFLYKIKKNNKELNVICNFSNQEHVLDFNIKMEKILINNYKEIKEKLILPFQAITYWS
jgi:trehalose-6-phosphate hydrolase